MSFEVTFEESSDGETDSSRCMVPDLGSSRGESTTSKVGFVLRTCRTDWLEDNEINKL